jgi:peptidoglycan/LPS O-acetylase OafA/YrhL
VGARPVYIFQTLRAEVEYPVARDTLAAHGKHRFQALDGLRGVAALLVVLLHVGWSNHLTENNFVQHGYLAVDLFFILSGLVISSNYSHRITNLGEARSFMGLRFFRLYPLHLAILGGFVCLECAKLVAQHAFAIRSGPQPPFTGGDSFGALVANLFVIHGLHVLDGPSWNGPSWVISCEFAAYLAFSILVLAGLVRSRLFFLAGSLIAGASYAVIALKRGTLNVTVDWGIIRCLAGFFLGMLIFRFKRRNIVCQSRVLIGGCEIAVTIAIILTMSFTSGPLIAFVIPLFVIAIALLQFDQGPLARLLVSPVAQFLGRISYSIYMVHSFLVVCLLIILKRVFVLPMGIDPIRGKPIVMINPWTGDLLVLGVVIVVVATASATYALIEEPGRLFGRRLFAISRNRLSASDSPDIREAVEPKIRKVS